jgi:hypothetical protein
MLVELRQHESHSVQVWGDLEPPVLLHCCGNIALDAEGFPDLCEGSELVVWDGLRLANSKT